MIQGAPLKKEKLTRIFQALIDNPDNLEFVKNLIKECKAAEKKSAEEVVGECQDHEVITNFLNGVHQGSNIGRYVEYKLKHWTDIYVVTPFIDVYGIDLLITLTSVDRLSAVYVRDVCYWQHTKLDDIISQMGLGPTHWIGDKFYSVGSKQNPKTFHGKLFAGCDPQNSECVEVLVTSCNLTKEHFESMQLETIITLEMNKEEFLNQWIDPIKKLNFDPSGVDELDFSKSKL